MTEPTLNAAQLQIAEHKAREMFAKWVAEANLRKWAAELAYKGPPTSNMIGEATKIYIFVTGSAA